jgi:hypothetical protein
MLLNKLITAIKYTTQSYLFQKQFLLFLPIKSGESFVNRAKALILFTNFLIISIIIMRIVLVINKIILYSLDLSTIY